MNKNNKKFSYRKATSKNMKIFYNWVNEPEVRRNALNKKHIFWNSHKNWFKKKMQNKKSTLYVFKNREAAIGQVRFDKQNKIVMISYSISKKFRGRGLGKKMLAMAIKKYKQSKRVILAGKVRSRNLPSIKVFKSLGFKGNLNNKIYYFKKIYI